MKNLACISNLVIIEKKDSGDIRVTLDCQPVNKEQYTTHEPILAVEELRHEKYKEATDSR